MEQPKLVKLTSKSGPRSLQIVRGDVVFWVDGVQRIFPSYAAAEVVVIIADSNPQTVSTKELFKSLYEQFKVGSYESYDRTIYKYISEARKAISNAGIKVSLIRNIRNSGYRLDLDWTVDLVDGTTTIVDTELHGIKKLIERCVDYMQTQRLITNSGGLMYLRADYHQTQENFVILERFGWQLIHTLSKPDTVSDVIDVKKDIEKLMTYVLFWRVGDGLTEEKWKADYKAEIFKIFSDIEIRIKKIQEILYQAKQEIRES